MLFYPSRQTRQSRRESAKIPRPQNTSTRTHPPSRLLQDGDTQTRFCAIPFLPRVARTASTHVGRPFRPHRSPSVPPFAHQRAQRINATLRTAESPFLLGIRRRKEGPPPPPNPVGLIPRTSQSSPRVSKTAPLSLRFSSFEARWLRPHGASASYR